MNVIEKLKSLMSKKSTVESETVVGFTESDRIILAKLAWIPPAIAMKLIKDPSVDVKMCLMNNKYLPMKYIEMMLDDPNEEVSSYAVCTISERERNRR